MFFNVGQNVIGKSFILMPRNNCIIIIFERIPRNSRNSRQLLKFKGGSVVVVIGSVLIVVGSVVVVLIGLQLIQQHLPSLHFQISHFFNFPEEKHFLDDFYFLAGKI